MSELAADGIPVTVTCRVLKLARQPYYRWREGPISGAELTRAYVLTLCSTPTTITRSSGTGSSPTKHATPVSRWLTGRRGGSAVTTAGGAASARRSVEERSPGRRSMMIWSTGSSPPSRTRVVLRYHRTPDTGRLCSLSVRSHSPRRFKFKSNRARCILCSNVDLRVHVERLEMNEANGTAAGPSGVSADRGTPHP